MATGSDTEIDGTVDVELHKRHILRPRALAIFQVSARLETCRHHLLSDVRDGLLLTRRGWAATFECVRRERLNVGGQPRRVDRHICTGRDGEGPKRESGASSARASVFQTDTVGIHKPPRIAPAINSRESHIRKSPGSAGRRSTPGGGLPKLRYMHTVHLWRGKNTLSTEIVATTL